MIFKILNHIHTAFRYMDALVQTYFKYFEKKEKSLFIKTIKYQNNKVTSFTLIELLVVVAIIALLLIIALPTIQNARVNARDAKRMEDIKAIQNALELQMTTDGYYLDSDGTGGQAKCIDNCGSDCNNLTNYLKKIPQDPLGSSKACYLISSDGKNFRIAAKLESKANREKAQNDGGIYPQFFERASDPSSILLTNYVSVWPDKTVLDPLYNNLVGWWAMEEGSGSTAADFSMHGNNGTLQNNPTWITANCLSGGCLNFDDADAEYVACPSILTYGNNTFTVEAWYNLSPKVTPNNWYTIFAQSVRYGHFDQRGLVTQHLKDNGTYTILGTSSGSYSGANWNTWTHIVTVYNNKNVTTYINATLKGAISTTDDLSEGNTKPFWIARDDYLPNSFHGLIDEIRIYNKALSASEVCQRCREFKSASFCNNCSE